MQEVRPRVLDVQPPTCRAALVAFHHVPRAAQGRPDDNRRRLPRGLLVAARQHPAGRSRHGLVGLRVPDQRHRESHDHRGREHVEPRAHRDAGPLLDGAGEGRPPDRSPPRRLCPHLDRRRRRRPCQVAAHGSHRQQRLQRHLPGRPDLQSVRLLPGWQPDPDDGRVAALQAPLAPVPAGHHGGPRPLQGGVPVQVRQGAHLSGAQGFKGVQSLGRQPSQPNLRRSRVVVLRRAVPPRAAQAHLPPQELRPA
mmetsp:Transcript_53379/g.121689  ORF Transcript_53379/g.121689 Transcript_53379/m.121689 type:complete len:252 (-) Transcript_53379:815-1570(-)